MRWIERREAGGDGGDRGDGGDGGDEGDEGDGGDREVFLPCLLSFLVLFVLSPP
ncbi:MAG: hypothetical protein RIE73_28050 [Coleofasciculus sp. C1-SOL-03]|uniref:hypothetical protein n=1 Tax=Coleofasciculus sp. C1-SOL-03 TaxID=3069522 RepID=UPI0032FC0E90